MTHQYIEGHTYLLRSLKWQGEVEETIFARYVPVPIPHFYDVDTDKKISLQQTQLNHYRIYDCTPIEETT